MGLFSRKDKNLSQAPKPIAGPTPPPAPGTPVMAPNVAPPTPVPPTPGVVASTNPTPPPAPNANYQNSPSNMGNTPSAPSFGGGFKPNAPMSTMNSGYNSPMNNNNDEKVPERKYDIFNENERYSKFDFSKMKIDKLDLSTNPDPRAIRKHIKKLLEVQKQLIAMQKDLTSRRDYIDKYIYDEKENQKPKILVDLLEGKAIEENNNNDEAHEAHEDDRSNKINNKKDVKKQETSPVVKTNKEKKSDKNNKNDDIFKSVEEMLSK